MYTTITWVHTINPLFYLYNEPTNYEETFTPRWKFSKAKEIEPNKMKNARTAILTDPHLKPYIQKTLLTEIITKNKEKADKFAIAFANVSSTQNYSPSFQVYKNKFETENSAILAKDESTSSGNSGINANLTLFELESAINQLKNGSAPGEDDISYEIIKHLPTSSHRLLLKILNQSWNQGIVPKKWKHSIVLPLLKAGKDPSQISSYRPISLTSSLSKLLEKIITNRLEWFLNQNQILSPNQTGFRKNRSTLDQIIRLQDEINKFIQNKGHTLGLFLDFEKAFDLLWHSGLLSKLRKIGLYGNIFNWIKDFITGRTIQVKIGQELSSSYPIENGTAQGSIISPLLFLIMINDLAENINNSNISLFADDTAIFKSNRNIKLLESTIQENLNKIQKWCDKNGFKISKEKTVAILFTKSSKKFNVNITLQNNSIKLVDSAKFLGVIFDKKLTWQPHIDYIVTKCKKRINLLRSTSGTNWGASTKALLTIYRTLIRPIIEYADISYDTAKPTHLKKLDRIQSLALKICLGATKNTPLEILQAELDEPPLHLKRLQHQLTTIARAKFTPNHPAKSITEDHWTNHYSKCKAANPSIYTKTSPYHKAIFSLNIESPHSSQIAPWNNKPVTTDDSLTQEIKKSECPTALLTLAKQEIQILTELNHTIIYTDASKTTQGKTGIGIYINETTKWQYRLSNDISIFAAEMTAIKTALELVKNIKANKITIATDSLSSLRSIKSRHSNTNTNLLNNIFCTIAGLKPNINILWIPSHIGIHGNEAADKLASTATQRETIDIIVPFEYNQITKTAAEITEKLWSQQWKESPKISHYFNVTPKLHPTIPLASNRHDQRLFFRLRSGFSNLNQNLYIQKCHTTGLCEYCQLPETTTHFLTECKSQIVSDLKNYCLKSNIPFNLNSILNDLSTLKFIASKINKKL
jgi:ribonuclease HI